MNGKTIMLHTAGTTSDDDLFLYFIGEKKTISGSYYIVMSTGNSTTIV
nr:MAG TPA: hypothetical protein [Caudoviricetes sp.]